MTSQDPDVKRAVDMAKRNLQEAKKYLKDVIKTLEDELKKLTELCKRKDLIRRLEHLRGALKVLDRYFKTPIIIINPDLYPNPANPQPSET